MRPIKFDLPLNGTRIANLEQLEDNLTPEILEPFRSGKLAKWLRARSLDEQAGAVEALLAANVQDEVQLFIKLCEVFEREVDEDIASDMIEEYKSSLAASNEVSSETINETEQTESVEENYEEQNTVVEEAQKIDVVIKAKTEITPAKPKEYVINQKLLAVLARDKSFGHSFYVMNDIPSKKLKNAINAYGGVGVEYETPLILFDGTLMGSAKEGFLLTTESLSICTTWETPNDKEIKLAIPLKDIYEISITPSPIIKVNSKYFRFNNSEENNWKAFKAFFQDYLALG